MLTPLLASSLLWASDDCAPVRLDQDGGTFTNIPVRDQKYGTCSVETTTQFMEAVARKEGANALTFSSIEYLISVSEKFGDFSAENFEGYTLRSLINDAFSNGLCSQTKVAEKLKVAKLDEYKLITLLETYLSRIYGIQSQYGRIYAETEKRYQDRQHYTRIDNVDMGQTRKNYLNETRSIQPQLNRQVESVKDSIRTVAGVNRELYPTRFNPSTVRSGHAALNDLFPIVCAFFHRTLLPRARIIDDLVYDYALQKHVSNFRKHDSIPVRINRALNERKALPIPIGYCVSSIRDGQGANKENLRNRNDLSRCGPHASLLIGQRKNPKTQKCEYLIRNSWGTNWAPLRDSEGVEWEGEKYTYEAQGCAGMGRSFRCGTITYNAKKNLTGNLWVERDGFIKNMLLDYDIYAD